MKAKIGIVCGILRDGIFKTERVYANREYIAAITKTGGTPLLLPVVEDQEALEAFVELCDGFLFTGGVDVSPVEYGEEPQPLLGDTHLGLDEFQLALFKMVIQAKKPFLAICRGTQVMNVACGGTLYQDVSYAGEGIYKHSQQTDTGDGSHGIEIAEGSLLESLLGKECFVNSYHHQSVKKVGQNLKVTAKATDGIVEAVELQEYGFGLGVQWHPEVMFAKRETMGPLFQGLVEAAVENRQGK